MPNVFSKIECLRERHKTWASLETILTNILFAWKLTGNAGNLFQMQESKHRPSLSHSLLGDTSRIKICTSVCSFLENTVTAYYKIESGNFKPMSHRYKLLN